MGCCICLDLVHLDRHGSYLLAWLVAGDCAGGVKNASWLFKMRDGRQFTTLADAVTYMQWQLQEPAPLAAATAAAEAAQQGAPAAAEPSKAAPEPAQATEAAAAAAAARQGVRAAAAPCEQPPAKKHCTAERAGGSVAAASFALKHPHQAEQGAEGQQQGAANRAPGGNAAAKAGEGGCLLCCLLMC